MIKKSNFKQTWWLNNAHLQTIWPTFSRRKSTLKCHRERIELADNDFIDLDWAGDNSNSPIVIILHGLCGSSNSPYAWGLQQALLNKNYRSVVMNFRGCSGEHNRLPRSYHSGETEDINTIFQLLKSREPSIDFAVVGYSLGGNVVLKWLGELGKDSCLKAAVAISVPFQLNVCADYMDQGFSRLYRNRFIRLLRTNIDDKIQFFSQQKYTDHLTTLRNLGDLSNLTSFWEFDANVTAKLNGFNNAHDYYTQCSSQLFLKKIHTPTLILQAENDPILHKDSIPQDQDLSSAVTIEVSKGGGHVGFISGYNPLKPLFWLEQRIPAFLHTKLKMPMSKQ